MAEYLRQRETLVAEPAWVRTLVWLGFPLVGGGVGLLLKSVAGWAAYLPWAPFQGPLKLVASVGEPWATIGALVVGCLGGLVLAFIAAEERLTVTVSDDQVRMVRGDSSQAFERSQVSVVFLEGKRLVLLGHGADELARESSDLEADSLKDAFLVHGYPWQAGGDPYKDQYRLWVEDTPDLEGGVNALLKARARALAKGDSGKDDAAEMRRELAKLGIVVREENKQQYWRRSGERGTG